MRKKYFIPVLLVTAALALTACESEEVVTTEEATEATTEEAATTPVKKERAKITVSGIPEEMLKVGDEFTLTAEGAENYTFRSYNEDVATVDANGVVKIVATGSFRIRVDAKGAMYQMVSLYVPTEEEVKAIEELAEKAEVKTRINASGKTEYWDEESNSWSPVSSGSSGAWQRWDPVKGEMVDWVTVPAGEFMPGCGADMAALIRQYGQNERRYEKWGYIYEDSRAEIYGDPALDAIARERAIEISKNFSHAGSRPGTAEAICQGAATVNEAFNSWRNSPGHWAYVKDNYGMACRDACYNAGNDYYAVYVSKIVDTSGATIVEDLHPETPATETPAPTPDAPATETPTPTPDPPSTEAPSVTKYHMAVDENGNILYYYDDAGNIWYNISDIPR